MGDVIDFDKGTYGEIPVEGVLEGAKDLAVVVVMGFTKSGVEYFASSTGDYKECAWLAGRYIRTLMELKDYEDGYDG